MTDFDFIRTVFEIVGDSAFIKDRTLRYTAANPAMERLFGLPASELIGRTDEELFGGAAAVEIRAANLRVLNGETVENELTLPVRGVPRTFHVIKVPLRDSSGAIIGLCGIARDITERKKTEHALQESEHRFRELFNHMSSGVAVYEAKDDGCDFIIKDFNRAGERIDKVRRDEIIGRSVLEVFPGIKKLGLLDVFQRVRKTGEPEQHPTSLYQDDRLIHWVTNYVYKLPSGELVAIYEDVTERKRAEEELRRAHGELEKRVAERTAQLTAINEKLLLEIESRRQAESALAETNQRLETIFNHMHMLVAYLDPQFNFIRVNRAYAEADEREVSFFPGKNHFELYPHAENEAIFRRVVESGEPFSACAKAFKYAENPERGVSYWDWSLTPITGEGGTVTGLVLTITNVSERKRAEQQLMEYHQQLRSLASELTLAEERERRRMAVLLHDNIAQPLAFAVMMLGAAPKTTCPPACVRIVGDARMEIEHAIQSTRSLTFELSPPVLYELGFKAAAEWLAERAEKQSGVSTEVRDDGQPLDLSDDVRIALFQATRELLANVVKHAHATRATITLRRRGEQVQVEVADDGVGFEHATAVRRPETGGFGLFSIRERLSLLGGGMTINAQPGRGCRVILTVPVRARTSEQKAHDADQDPTGR